LIKRDLFELGCIDNEHTPGSQVSGALLLSWNATKTPPVRAENAHDVLGLVGVLEGRVELKLMESRMKLMLAWNV
jgi:hypothetical protein